MLHTLRTSFEENGVLFVLSGAVGTCKPKVLDVLLLDRGGQRAIILAVTNYVIKVIVK